MTKEERRRKEEALKRLDIMWKKGMMSEVKRIFKEGDIAVFERMNIGGRVMGCLLTLDDIASEGLYEKHKLKEKVEEAEKKFNGTVYLITIENTDFGLLMDMFYVSNYEDEWDDDKANLKDGYAYVYCQNLTNEWCSELGSIMYGIRTGSVIREG